MGREMWTYICPELLTSIEREPEEQVVPEMMESFAKCTEVLPMGFITQEHFTQLATIIHEKLEKHQERQTERVGKRKEEDYDEEVEEILKDEHDTDSYILSKVSDCMHSLFKTHKEAILPFFEHMLPDFVKLLEPQQPHSDRQWALCIFDDLLEYAGPSSIKYQDVFLTPMLNSVQDANAEVRQAVTKICKYNASKVDVNSVLTSWLSWLPVVEDHAEAPHVYGYLCDLIEANHPVVLGVNNANIPAIIRIFAQSFVCEVYETNPELAHRIRTIVMQVKGNEAVWNATVGSLNEEQQTALKAFLEGIPVVAEN